MAYRSVYIGQSFYDRIQKDPQGYYAKEYPLTCDTCHKKHGVDSTIWYHNAPSGRKVKCSDCLEKVRAKRHSGDVQEGYDYSFEDLARWRKSAQLEAALQGQGDKVSNHHLAFFKNPWKAFIQFNNAQYFYRMVDWYKPYLPKISKAMLNRIFDERSTEVHAKKRLRMERKDRPKYRTDRLWLFDDVWYREKLKSMIKSKLATVTRSEEDNMVDNGEVGGFYVKFKKTDKGMKIVLTDSRW